jgi:hypothetical protein
VVIIEKFCVFCGREPESKTKEHVIPQWLIEYTGDPKRVITAGYNNAFRKRKFSFDQFQFPACYHCNQKFSKLEDDAKRIYLKIINNNPLLPREISILLDWIDKIRIGLWLGSLSLAQNPFNINPNFYIENRIGKTDRMLAIYATDDHNQRLTFLGISTPAFTHVPSCFALLINNLCFFNISTAFLFSKEIGFPYPLIREYIYDGKNLHTEYALKSGLNRVSERLLLKPVLQPCTEIFQPMFIHSSDLEHLYSNGFIKSNCIDYENGIGKVFYKDNNVYKVVSDKGLTISQKGNFNQKYLDHEICIQTLKFQNFLLQNILSDIALENIKFQYSQCISFNNKLLDHYNRTS